VKLVGWKNRQALNGQAGTVVRCMNDGKWRVKMDADGLDKIVTCRHLQRIDGPVHPSAKTVPDSMQLDEACGSPSISSTELPNYSIAGTWDAWAMHTMSWDADYGCYNFEVELGRKGFVSFKLLQNGDWNSCWIPDEADACPHKDHTIRGPEKNYKSNGNSWTIGKHLLDEGGTGVKYKVRVFISDILKPYKVDWLRLDTFNNEQQHLSEDGDLQTFLQAARPEWKENDVITVAARLRRVNIRSVQEVVQLTNSKEDGGLNGKLRAAGEKCFAADTLAALRKAA